PAVFGLYESGEGPRCDISRVSRPGLSGIKPNRRFGVGLSIPRRPTIRQLSRRLHYFKRATPTSRMAIPAGGWKSGGQASGACLVGSLAKDGKIYAASRP